ncbi:MAG: SGNH/GDSL hydrolase family protein [Rhodospirillales bacterium]|nr:SGNH/GDSL hydrolase family protein [Rhodospirillales bacterium]
MQGSSATASRSDPGGYPRDAAPSAAHRRIRPDLSLARRSILAALALALAAPLQPAAARPAPRAALPHVAARLAAGEGIFIIAFGSSSTQGLGASSAAATYPSQLQTDLRHALPGRTVRVENAGIAGEDARSMDRRLPAIIAAHPDLVIWQTGSNDPLNKVPVSEFSALTARGIRAMQAAGIDVMLMDPQYCRVITQHGGSRAYRHALHILGARYHVPVIRRFDWMRRWLDERLITPAALLAPDGLHMADGGYARLSRDVGRRILALAPPGPVAAR